MAIGKWISFAQPASAIADTSAPKSDPIPCTADGKQFGLENFGNTCYANSVLQALYFCRPFRELVIQHTDPYASLQNALSHFSPTHLPSPATVARRKPDRKSTQESSPPNAVSHPPTPPVPSAPRTLFSALRALYVHISRNPADKGTVAPRAFIEKLRELNEAFRNTMHQDAHEFLNYLLNRIVEDIEEEKKHRLASGDDLPCSMISSSTISHPPVTTASASSSSIQPPGATFIHRIFEGTLTSETRCLTCENVSSRDESFLDLSIDIERNSSVTACLRQFSASEMLCQKEKFFCDSCCDLQEAERRMKIKRLPNVLALHLKRFKYQEEVQKFTKLTYRVAFPFELRLFNTVDDIPNPDRLYELFAIVVHIGNGPNHGHYVSIIKTMGTWFLFDDETVESVKECDIPKYFGDSSSGSAYVLYYQALDIDPSALGFRPPSPEPVTLPVPRSEQTQQLQQTDSPASTAQSIPSLPPGLADDVTNHTPARPTTPPTQSSLEPPEKSPRKVPSQILKAALGRPGAHGHGPMRNDAVHRQQRPTIDEKHSTVSKPVSPINIFPKQDSHPSGAAHGKEKEPDKSMMRWLRRRSLKSIKSRPSSEANADVPPVPQDVLAAPSSPARDQSTSSSSNSSKDSRRQLDSPTPGHNSPRTSPIPNGKPPSLSRTTDKMDLKYPSARASSDSTPISPPPSHRSQSRPLTSVPASPQSPTTPPSSFARKSLDRNRERRHVMPSDFNSPPPTKSSNRPATSSGPTRGYSPPPIMPPSIPPRSHLRVPSRNVATGRYEPDGDPAVERPQSAGASYLFMSSLPASLAPLVPVPVPVDAMDATPKRAMRKLSLSTPMLGFKKRDGVKQ